MSPDFRRVNFRRVIAGEWRLVLTALQFLTRLPVPAWVGHGPGQLDRAMRYLPLVGIGVGLVGAMTLAAAGAGWPQPVAALISVAATLLLTGALHEDGLADTLDGLFGGATRDEALRIMRDSQVGSYGAVGLIVALGLKVTALAALPEAGAALVAGHAFSRFMAVCVIAGLPYARTDGKAGPIAGGVGALELAVAGVFGLLPLLLLGGRAIAALLMAGGLAWGMARWFRRRLGGYTGDGLGAVQQVTEVAVLLAALWRAG